MKKGRHRRYEEARNLKRGPDLDIEALFTDLGGEPAVAAAVDAPEKDDDEDSDEDYDGYEDSYDEFDERDA